MTEVGTKNQGVLKEKPRNNIMTERENEGGLMNTNLENAFLLEPSERALRGYIKSYRLPITDRLDPLVQLNDARGELHDTLRHELEIMKGLKFVETLEITFEKQLDKDNTTHKTAYFNSTASTITNEGKITPKLRSVDFRGIWMEYRINWWTLSKYQPVSTVAWFVLHRAT